MLANYDAEAIASLMGVALLRSVRPWPADIERAVETGLPRRGLRRVVEKIAGRDKAKVVVLERDVVP